MSIIGKIFLGYDEWVGGGKKFLGACATGCYKRKIAGVWKCVRCGEEGL